MRPEGATWVKSLATSLKGATAREIRIEGHADSAPIKSAVFPSNWELSSARAAQALRVFLTEGLPPPKLIASGFADSRPIAEGNSPEVRARNRRIEFTVVPDLRFSCKSATPASAPAPDPDPQIPRKGDQHSDGCVEIGGNLVCPESNVARDGGCVEIGGNLVCPNRNPVHPSPANSECVNIGGNIVCPSRR